MNLWLKQFTKLTITMRGNVLIMYCSVIVMMADWVHDTL